MRFILIVLSMFLLLTSYVAQSDEHTHAIQNNEANSEEDRFIAMYYESECEGAEAAVWYERSLAHSPSNDLARRYKELLPTFLKEEGAMWMEAARKYQRPEYYYMAITCDRTNISFLMEAEFFLREQNLIRNIEVLK